MDGTNDNDTWTRIGLAAARVLTQIEQEKEFVTGVQQGAHRHDEAGEDDSKSASKARVVRDKKLAL
ncbi:hypothetical protein [Bradyrhizobium sp. 62]|uniref:hypothetical protein n=1 Tax=Bradyrhizobium sp. 62 TaxID=1043588 RepID=UPI001FF8D6E8|nr:hypothetical protein [Bradyrhizobium sp. 62]MCK1367655.1 hypothetical protein [Bradyrhizobium sp. 62]